MIDNLAQKEILWFTGCKYDEIGSVSQDRCLEALASLPLKEHIVLVLRYGLAGGSRTTLKQTATILGVVSPETIRRRESTALHKFRESYTKLNTDRSTP